MITYEQEHDFASWDLQLFNSDLYANCGYGGVVTLEDEEHCPANYFKEDCYDAGECCNIENDEAIAHTLQLQELSQLVVFESPNQGEEEELQLHVVGYPHQSVILVLDRIGARKSGMLTDEHALDGEVEKRLNQMVPLPLLIWYDPAMLISFSLARQLLIWYDPAMLIWYDPAMLPPSSDVPGFGTKKKKRWRMFRNKHLESQDEYFRNKYLEVLEEAHLLYQLFSTMFDSMCTFRSR
ncbi:hypothetical protein GQ457_08G000820 [Hibiscus cannabinus]